MSYLPLKHSKLGLLLSTVLLLPILAACGGGAPVTTAPTAGTDSAPAEVTQAPAEATEAPAEATEAPAEATEAPVAAGEPQTSPINDKTLIIGLNQAPDTLYNVETSASVTVQVVQGLGAAITQRDYAFQPVAFEEIPTIENGGVVSETVAIDPSAISTENPIAVGNVAITDTALLEGDAPTELPQLTLTYKIKPGLFWEDGSPVVAADAVEALRVVKDPASLVSVRRITDLTIGYETPDDSTVVITMAPGWVEADYGVLASPGFIASHVYNGQSIEQIREAEGQHPLSFGPYMVQENIQNESTTLVSNPYANPQPKIGTIIFKYVTDSNQLLAQLESGEIDMISSVGLQLGDYPKLQELQDAGTITVQAIPAASYEHIDFGIERLDGAESFFTDARVRNAVASAIDRDAIIQNVLYGQSQAIDSYIPPEHPSFDPSLKAYSYDPEVAKSLLDEAGWVVGSDGIREKDGRRFSVTLATTEGNATRKAATEIIQQQLGDVGIEVQLVYEPGGAKLFAQGAEGTLSGRTFDLALFAWGLGSSVSHDLFRSDAVPTPENGYAGQNYTAFRSEEFDAAATAAQTELNATARKPLDVAAAKILLAETPTFPLFQRVKITAFKPTVSGVALNATVDADTWNIEEWDIEP